MQPNWTTCWTLPDIKLSSKNSATQNSERRDDRFLRSFYVLREYITAAGLEDGVNHFQREGGRGMFGTIDDGS